MGLFTESVCTEIEYFTPFFLIAGGITPESAAIAGDMLSAAMLPSASVTVCLTEWRFGSFSGRHISSVTVITPSFVLM